MRAKNEFKFIAEAYDTKLILERIVDGKLMCPEACCGAPVIECTCGEDCPHCNCFMIHKAMKSNGLTDKLLKENLRQHQFFKKGIGDALKEIFDIPKDKPKKDEDAESDAGLWRDQMKHQSEVSPEELERIKKQKPAPQGRLTMPGDKDRDDTRTLKEMQRDIMNGMTAKESMEGMGIHPANQKSLLAKYMEFSKGSEGPIETGFEGPIISQLDVDAAARERLRQKYGEDNEEPRRGISGYEHKPDALVSARQAGAKHKPYVSSFVGDGGKKIFAILGSDGKIVHKTHNKQEAHQWLKDNYENI